MSNSETLSRRAVAAGAFAAFGGIAVKLADPAAAIAAATGPAGGDLGGSYPAPKVLKATGATLEVAGRLNLNLSHGLAMNSAGVLNAAQDSASAVRLQSYVTDTQNGSNGGRGDSILSDLTSASGSSFYMNNFQSGVHNTRGSYQGYTAIGTINEAREGAGIYGELGLFEAALTTNRRGAYTACMEAANIIKAGKQARATGLVVLLNEANALSSYTMLSPAWNETGTRGLWLASTGANPAGTAMFIQGDWARAAVYVQFANQGNYLLYSKQAGAASPFFRINGLGKMEWGDTAAVTSNLYNASGGYLKTDQGLIVGGNTLALSGSAKLWNLVAGNETTTASAGSSGPAPAQVAGYLTFLDSSGTARKIAYYAS